MTGPGATAPEGQAITLAGLDPDRGQLVRAVLHAAGYRVQDCEPERLGERVPTLGQAVIAFAGATPAWLTTLRGRPGAASLPVLVLATSSSDEVRNRWIRAGADEVLDASGDLARLVPALQARIDRAAWFAPGPQRAASVPQRDGALRRGEFLEQLDCVLRAGAGAWQVLMALRVDQAKGLAEELGQGAAYALEQAIAARLADALQAGDAHSLWMQFGFGVLARRDSREQVEALAQALCRCVDSAPFTVAGKERRLTASVGVALAPAGADAGDPDRWFASAHAAQAIAHRLGGNRFDGVLSRDHGALPPERVLIIREWVKEAVSGENVLIEFQPMLPLRGDPGLYRLDARLRDYRAPLAGVARHEYLGLAREAGALPMIDRMSLFAAFEAIEQEREQGRATQVLVPLDLTTVNESQLVWLDAELRRRKAHSDGLVVEFDAAMALGRPELARVVQRFEDHGIVIAVSDDAGDLSRIGQLQRFPASLLRLPLAAIDSVPPARFRELLAPWRGSGRSVVADQVPTIEAVARLYDMDIGFVQGDALAASGPRLDYEFSQFGR